MWAVGSFPSSLRNLRDTGSPGSSNTVSFPTLTLEDARHVVHWSLACELVMFFKLSGTSFGCGLGSFPLAQPSAGRGRAGPVFFCKASVLSSPGCSAQGHTLHGVRGLLHRGLAFQL